MNKVHFLLLLLFSILGLSQIQSNDFEINNDLDIIVGPDSMDSIWQIGVPQKAVLDSAYSLPNVLISDSIETYGVNMKSTFIVRMNEFSVWGFPYIQLEWMQKTDFEDGVDGGVIETSYDDGLTWSNVFDDPNFRPFVVGSFLSDSLHTDQMGITGVTDWSWVAICWGTNTGTPPENLYEILVRFTLVSDSVDTNQEGWMIDNMAVYGGIIGSVDEQALINPISIYPNPTSDFVNIDLTELNGRNAIIEIFDSTGSRLHSDYISLAGTESYTLDVNDYMSGVYFVMLRVDGKLHQQKFIKEE